MSQSDKAGAIAEQVLVGLHIHLSAVVNGHDAQGNALALTDKLPGYDIAVMLHHGDDDFIAVLKHLAKRGGDKIDALGRATGKDHFLDTTRVDKGAHLFAREFHQIGGLLREGVHAAVHIGLIMVVHLVYGLNYLTRCLGCCGIVKVDEGAALYLTLQDGIILTNLVDVHCNF